MREIQRHEHLLIRMPAGIYQQIVVDEHLTVAAYR
jgi:hypothetical protein